MNITKKVFINPFSADLTKRSNTLKKFVDFNASANVTKHLEVFIIFNMIREKL